MKNLTTQLHLASRLSLILLACTATYGQLTPSGDSYINTATPTTNYGAKTTLDVESTQTTFIQFDLSSIPSAYTSADITKATLKLFVDGVTTAGSFNVDYVNGTWTESTIDASNAPALGTTIAASVPLTTKDKNQYILVDVTAAVQAWLSGTANDGIALVANSPLNATFDSKEATKTSHTAELDIVFAGGGTLTGITTASGSGLTGGGTSGTLNLSLTNACAANQVLQYNGSSWVCAAVGTGTITGVTAGTDLTGGGTSGNVTLSLNTAATNALYAQLGAANTFTGNQTATGTITGGTASGSTLGVLAESNATSGLTYGVQAITASPSGIGVEGTSPYIGVYGSGLVGAFGSTSTTTGAGVEGVANSSTGTTYGVIGTTYSLAGTGAIGIAAADGSSTISTSGEPYGVVGMSPTTAVYGASSGVSATGGSVVHTNGVWGDYGGAAAGTGIGVLGTADDNYAGIFYNNGGAAVPAVTVGNMTSTALGEVFWAWMPNLLGEHSAAIIGDPGCSGNGVYFIALQLGQEGMSNCNNYTLTGGTNGHTYLNASSGATVHLRVGNQDVLTANTSVVNVVGVFTAGDKEFKIDHPLDPANKYLFHTSVESSEMMNIYAGNVTTGGEGVATVQLPDWFEALNTDFRYQLTVIGQFAQAIVASEISGNQFGIRTDKPNVKVSWQVTGVRHDAFANANRTPAEVEKAPADRGRYLYPELYGAPDTARIGYMPPAPGSEQIVRHQRPNLQRGNASPAQRITLPALPKPVLPKVAPLPRVAPLLHPAAQAGKPEVNQK